jgi:hypothetical protein
MRYTTWLVCLAILLTGCGGGSSGSRTPTPTQVVMQTGQWEFTIASTNGNPNIYLEADMASTPVGAIGSYITATALFWPQTGGSIAGLYDYCVNWQTSVSVTGNSVTVLLFSGSTQVAQATATLSPDGKSMTGTFQLNGVAGLCAAPVTASGTFTGQVIAPLNGTYKGSLSDGSQLTINVTQDSGYDITASGTSVLSGVTTNLTVGPNSGSAAYNNVIGAAVSGGGTATNVNGTQTFQVNGHFTPDASQLSFVSYNGQWSTGTLTKQ